MNRLLLSLALCAFSVLSCFGQLSEPSGPPSSPAFQVWTGANTPASGYCATPQNIGSQWHLTGGTLGAYMCEQTGTNSQDQGAFVWTPIQFQPSGGTTGTISVANGKAAVISNSLTFAGTDGTTMTFPSTSGTVVTLAATQTLQNKKIGDATDATKAVAFSTSGATTATASTLTFAQTVARTITFPDASITVPGTVVSNCATANACSATTISSASKVVVGISAALNGASPAIATITGMPAFTSSSSYVCTANVNSASASTHVLAINYVSSSSVTFTGANGATDTVSYMCIGS